MAPRFTTLLTALLATAAVASPVPDTTTVTKVNSSSSDTFMGLPISNPDATNVVPNAYIVVYNKTFSQTSIDAHMSKISAMVAKRNLGRRSEVSGKLLSTSVRQFSMSGWNAMAMEADDLMMMDINSADEVSYIEADTYVQASALQTQTNAPTGLVRLSHAESAGNSTTAGYVFDSTAGSGITAYVVDTGIRTTHEEFQGRATMGFNAVNTVVSLRSGAERARIEHGADTYL
jgi:subtilisin family serine protease